MRNINIDGVKIVEGKNPNAFAIISDPISNKVFSVFVRNGVDTDLILNMLMENYIIQDVKYENIDFNVERSLDRLKIEERYYPDKVETTYIEYYPDKVVLAVYHRSNDYERLIHRSIIIPHRIKPLKKYVSDSYTSYDVLIDDQHLEGSYVDIFNYMSNSDFIIIDRKYLKPILSMILRHSEIERAYNYIGIYNDNGNFIPVTPFDKKIIPINNQTSVIVKNLLRMKPYSMAEEHEQNLFMDKFLKIIEEHIWPEHYIVTLMGYLSISPFLFSTETISMRPDLLFYGINGTGKTFTINTIVVPFLGSKVESGDTFDSPSRLGDLLSSSTTPVVIEEIEAITTDKKISSILKSRSTGQIDFVRKTPDQRQIRYKLLSPVIMTSNSRSILEMDRIYTTSRLLIFTLDKKIKLPYSLKYAADSIRTSSITLLYDYLNYSVKVIPDEKTLLNELRSNESTLFELLKDFELTDHRKMESYGLILLGLTLFNLFIENLKYDNPLKEYIEPETFSRVVEKLETEIKEKHLPSV